ncbi:MAG: transcriptional activator NhaR [Planctomycetota bacterium]|nr:transcriptional activator NhaR [Planctomycetota bacterium]
MDFLNYHHLYYFYTVAKAGNLAKASEELSITPQTISSQIRALEKSIGKQLFDRQHRSLQLTKLGHKVFSYASSIFTIGRELQDFLSGHLHEDDRTLVVGVANALPKFVVHHLLEPALKSDAPTRLICHEDKAERLLAELALHNFDVVLSDVPVPPNISVRAYNHLLGKCSVALMAEDKLAQRYQDNFPQCLDHAPFLLPTDDTALRKSLDRWFHRNRIRPHIIAEHEDSALLKAFGEGGQGIFPVPAIVAEEVREHYHCQLLGVLEDVEEKFYAITVEKNVQHPAVAMVCQQARDVFFRK